jgi:SAM-dependent methyltransferase
VTALPARDSLGTPAPLGVVPPFSERILATLRPPGGQDDQHLALEGDGLRCVETGERFPFVGGIPSLLRHPGGTPAEITARIRSFYEEHPFPSYEGVEDYGALVNKGYQNAFTVQLLDAVGFNKTILECGCGTGQMSQFLQLNNNHTLGIDLSLSSLALATEHKRRNGLARPSFCQMDLFNLAIRDASFDVVISHGVLHHTFDARKAFSEIVKKCKPDGIVMVGLYNSYARIPTWIRARLIRVFGPRIDYVVRTRIRDAGKADIWVKDQYYNPHETWHSIDEVLRWFDENDVEYLNCSPPIFETSGETTRELFGKTDPGTFAKRALTQLAWLTTIAREGALFDVIGRRRGTG